jgi:hypothetical protein
MGGDSGGKWGRLEKGVEEGQGREEETGGSHLRLL